MKTTATKGRGRMKSSVRRRGKTFEFPIEHGRQPAVRCEQHGRFWVGHKPIRVCPECGGPVRETSERRQEWHGGYASEKEAMRARIDMLHELGKGTYVRRDTITLAQWLQDEWLPALRVGKLRPKTIESYASHVNVHLAPGALGRVSLQQLSPERIANFYVTLKKDGRSDGARRALSDSTVRRIHATLHRSLRDAARSHLLGVNPADNVELPSGKTRERPAWDSAHLRCFLESVRDDRLANLRLLFATTGARRGEVLGIKWEDVDLERGKLTIRRALLQLGMELIEGEPKTAKGRRTISLDAASVKALQRERRLQAQERLLLGPKWVDTGYVFTQENGEPWRPDKVSLAFNAAVKRSGLPRITLHGVRHSFVTIALNERHQPVGQVSARVGHADVGVTLNVYQHEIEKQDEVLADDFAGAVVPNGY